MVVGWQGMSKYALFSFLFFIYGWGGGRGGGGVDEWRGGSSRKYLVCIVSGIVSSVRIHPHVILLSLLRTDVQILSAEDLV